MQESVLQVEGLTFGYDSRRIFERFGFAASCRVTKVVGPSGCGKTTLLKLIHGIVVGAPAFRLQRTSPTFLVLQSDGLVPWLSGRENVEFVSTGLWARVRESPLFDLVAPFAERSAYELSFGERRLLELTRALLSGCPLLLLDEPLTFLDRVKRSRLIALMADPEFCPSNMILTSHYDEDDESLAAETYEFFGDAPYSSLVRRAD